MIKKLDFVIFDRIKTSKSGFRANWTIVRNGVAQIAYLIRRKYAYVDEVASVEIINTRSSIIISTYLILLPEEIYYWKVAECGGGMLIKLFNIFFRTHPPTIPSKKCVFFSFF